LLPPGKSQTATSIATPVLWGVNGITTVGNAIKSARDGSGTPAENITLGLNGMFNTFAAVSSGVALAAPNTPLSKGANISATVNWGLAAASQQLNVTARNRAADRRNRTDIENPPLESGTANSEV
jgi:hypothetical protein